MSTSIPGLRSKSRQPKKEIIYKNVNHKYCNFLKCYTIYNPAREALDPNSMQIIPFPVSFINESKCIQHKEYEYLLDGKKYGNKFVSHLILQCNPSFFKKKYSEITIVYSTENTKSEPVIIKESTHLSFKNIIILLPEHNRYDKSISSVHITVTGVSNKGVVSNFKKLFSDLKEEILVNFCIDIDYDKEYKEGVPTVIEEKYERRKEKSKQLHNFKRQIAEHQSKDTFVVDE